MGRLVFLLTSPRVAPGLLSWPAWEVLRGADRVLAVSVSAPLATAVAGSVPVEEGRPEVTKLLSLAGEQTVVWLAGEDGDPKLAADLATEVVRRSEAGLSGPEVEIVSASYDLPGSRLLDLVAVMDQLRLNCPWDQEQTHSSLVHYLIEETYETVEAIESGTSEDLREELGDLLLQVVFHARIAEEDPNHAWSIDDVAADIVDKLIRRHPHVFAAVEVSGAGEVETNWHSLKAAEKQRASTIDGVPLALPALTLADKLLSRAAEAGHRPPAQDLPQLADNDELGDRLFNLVIAAREAGLDAEQALRASLRRFAEAVRTAESGGRAVS
jgi:NTP pyrophosphatase (non-canonical NTP hydrolase)